MNILLALFSAVLLGLAFPKAGLFWLAWFALVPFFLALTRSAGWRERLLLGFVFGFVFFLFHLVWLLTLFRFVGWWVWLGWISLVLFQTIYLLIFAFAFPKIKDNPFLLAALWTVLEFLRAQGPFGLSAGGVGYSQAPFLPLAQLTALTSVYGVTFLVALFNAALLSKKKLFLGAALILAALAGLYGYIALQSPAPAGATLKLALIQPNIDQKTKLDPARVDEVFAIYKKMTLQAAAAGPDIIIWPETSVFTYLLHNPVLLPQVKELARKSRAWLVFGTPHYEGELAYNSIAVMSPQGEITGRYDKCHLVPFGEYLPYKPLLYPLLKQVGYFDAEFTPGAVRPLLIGKHHVAAAICFESIFPRMIRRRVRPDSAFILLVTNDAWFGDSSALYFHLDCGIFRAIENRKYFVQVGNTGISALIDPFGRVVKKTKVNRREILSVEVPLR